jgi:RNA polymerase sigma-70 factor (ECF subfamily)
MAGRLYIGDQDDKELVRRCLQGEKEAFGALLDRYEKPIYNLVFRMVNDRDDAEDLTQAIFVKAYEKLDTFDERFKFFSWLYKIAVNTSLNFVSHRRHQERLRDELVPNGVQLEEEFDESERYRKLEDAILALRVDHRIVIVLRHFQNLSYDEMSKILDIPAKTVKSRLFTARQILKNKLLKWGLQG